jgi:ubiquinone/menaquinone biosynthesis C-methylase UbiE
MFFPEKIVSIKNGDRVLEIGPGGNPHPRADVFLEKKFKDKNEAKGQRGYASELVTNKKVVYYEGNKFPFNDKEFDYVICSHVLEHVEDVSNFINEITRVGKMGYIEFPTIYYDYIYNFPEHVAFLLWKNNKISWMLKSESGIGKFQVIQDFFYHTMVKKYTCLVNDLKDYFFQGFEWLDSVENIKVSDLSELVFEKEKLQEIIKPKI